LRRSGVRHVGDRVCCEEAHVIAASREQSSGACRRTQIAVEASWYRFQARQGEL
jgi:hypothetical protein